MCADEQKRTLSIMILAACGQLGGLSIISTYSTYFFSLAGLDVSHVSRIVTSRCLLEIRTRSWPH